MLWYAASRFHRRIAAVGAEPYGFIEAREFADLEAATGAPGVCGRSSDCVRGSPTSSSVMRLGGCAIWSHWPPAGVDAVVTDAMFVAARLWHERGGPVWASLGDGPLTYADVDTPPYGAGLLPMRAGRGDAATG